MSMRTARSVSVQADAGDAVLQGDLTLPAGTNSVVLFAHGSGSSRHSRRNRYVAQVLNEGTIGTLLLDLLTESEEVRDSLTAELRFDIGLLARRVVGATNWLTNTADTQNLSLGYFGASTGAAAALVAAAELEVVRAIVSRGGRPDLAGEALAHVEAPTLLIVGGNDEPVIEMNRTALVQLKVDKRLEIIPGATHLFEEAGALERVAGLARDWFTRYLSRAAG